MTGRAGSWGDTARADGRALRLGRGVAALLVAVACAGCTAADVGKRTTTAAPPARASAATAPAESVATSSSGSALTSEPGSAVTSAPGSAVTSPSSPTAATTPTDDPDQARRQAVTELIGRRATALLIGDKAAWLSTVGDPASAFGQRQGAVFDRMRLLPIADFGLRAVDIAPALPASRVAALGGDAWVSTVHLSYRLAGYDRAPRRFDASLTVARTPSGWRFADDTDGGSQPQPWDIPSMAVVSSPTTLVIGNAPTATLKAHLTMADAAYARIAGVWGDALPAVLIAPASLDDFTAQLQRPDATGLDQVAAVTDGPIRSGTPATSDRVYLNPQAFARLTPDGRRVVLTHELTHVTVRGSTSRPVPIWLSEGFADYVGFTGLGLPPRTVAADLLTRVRDGTGPTRLPVAGDFDPAQGAIAPSYNAAWLAVTRMSQLYGQAKVVAFYRVLAGDQGVGTTISADPAAGVSTAFTAVLGTTQEAFVADWLAYLQKLAR